MTSEQRLGSDETQEKFDLESVFDSEIAPLMTKIIEVCKAHKLPMCATFLFANFALKLTVRNKDGQRIHFHIHNRRGGRLYEEVPR